MPFEDITVSHFTVGAGESLEGLVRFQFPLSQSAPEYWMKLARQTLRNSLPVRGCIRRKALVFHDRIVVLCAIDEVQKIKQVLNQDILLGINRTCRLVMQKALHLQEALA